MLGEVGPAGQGRVFEQLGRCGPLGWSPTSRQSGSPSRTGDTWSGPGAEVSEQFHCSLPTSPQFPPARQADGIYSPREEAEALSTETWHS